MKIGHTIDANGFYTGDVLEGSGITPDVTVICQDGFIRPKWNVSTWIEGAGFDLTQYKQVKINLLSATCNKTILAGFSSTALGISHNYDFDEEAQRNLTGRLSLINSNPNYPASFNWKTKDLGPLVHTKAQFIQLCTDADDFKDGKIAHYWTVKGQVSAAASQGEVDILCSSYVT